jgi:exosortase A-associated hydrolase 1
MRRLIAFPCAGEQLIGSLDEARGTTGLLIVSGGNEMRAGAGRTMAHLAQDLAAAGVPVFRFDRRGVGDSSGKNESYATSGPDVAAAAATFQAETGIRRLIAFGNCDAATALAQFHSVAGIDALVLANPWCDAGAGDALPPAAAVRERYRSKLRQPGEWGRLLTGGVDLTKLGKGLARVIASRPTPNLIAQAMADALIASQIPTRILLSQGDNTAIAFRDAWTRIKDRPPVEILHVESGGHGFVTPADRQWLRDRLLEVCAP